MKYIKNILDILGEKINSLESDLNLKNILLKECREENKKIKDENDELKQRIKILENKRLTEE